MTEANKSVFISVAKWIGFVILPIGLGGWLAGEPIGNFIVDHSVVYSSMLWVCLSMLFGAMEARYFFYKNSSPNNDQYNPHLLFTLIRGIVLVLIWVIVQSWESVASMALMFSFFHDGMYYVVRNSLDNTYSKGWFAQTTTSTSWMDIKGLTSPVVRTALCVIGIVWLIIFNYHNNG